MTFDKEKEKASRTKQRLVAATISSLMVLNTQVPVFSRRRRQHRRRRPASRISVHSIKPEKPTPRKRWPSKKPKTRKEKPPPLTLRPTPSEESIVSSLPISPACTKPPTSSKPQKHRFKTLATNLRTVFCPLQRSPAPHLALGGRLAIPRFEKRRKHQSAHDMYMVFITSDRLESAQGMRSPIGWERAYSVDETASPRWPLLDAERGRSLSLSDRSPSLSSRCWSPVSDERGRTPSLRYSSLGGLCPPPARQQWGFRSSSITEETMKLGPITW